MFAKAPRAGAVKTRMSPPFTPEEAAELYACMLADVLESTAHVCGELGLEPVLSVHPRAATAELARACPASFAVTVQCGADLSERMEWAVAQAAAAGALPVILRGSDSPLLPGRIVAAALHALERDELVVSPDPDGGYSLVGLRVACPGVFAHAMSTGSVLDDTLANARAAGLGTALLEPGSDVDTAADLATLARACERTDAERCRRTLDFLDRIDGWRHLDHPR